MEENMVMENVNEVAETAITEAVTDVAVPEDVITEVPAIEVSEPTIGIGKVILVASVAAAATYGAYKGVMKVLSWAKTKVKERKYANLRGQYEGADEEDMYVDETEADPEDVTEVKKTENVEA